KFGRWFTVQKMRPTASRVGSWRIGRTWRECGRGAQRPAVPGQRTICDQPRWLPVEFTTRKEKSKIHCSSSDFGLGRSREHCKSCAGKGLYERCCGWRPCGTPPGTRRRRRLRRGPSRGEQACGGAGAERQGQQWRSPKRPLIWLYYEPAKFKYP